jgi:hypothetical protein
MLMFPVLNRHSNATVVTSQMDAVFIAIMVLSFCFRYQWRAVRKRAQQMPRSPELVVFTQAQLYAYHFGMLTVGCAGLTLNYAFYRARLLPRVLGVCGLVGYAVILCGSVLEIMGFNLNLLHTLPGGLWEHFVGVWLIVKGFNALPASFERAP